MDRAEWTPWPPVPGVVGVHLARMRWIGHEIQADAELALDPSATRTEA